MCSRAFWTVLPWGSRTAFLGVMMILAFMRTGAGDRSGPVPEVWRTNPGVREGFWLRTNLYVPIPKFGLLRQLGGPCCNGRRLGGFVELELSHALGMGFVITARGDSLSLPGGIEKVRPSPKTAERGFA
jgi:hypothetical protein